MAMSLIYATGGGGASGLDLNAPVKLPPGLYLLGLSVIQLQLIRLISLYSVLCTLYSIFCVLYSVNYLHYVPFSPPHFCISARGYS
jgi:hypothetical protein